MPLRWIVTYPGSGWGWRRGTCRCRGSQRLGSWGRRQEEAGDPGAQWVGGTSPEGSGDGRRQEAGSQPLKTRNSRYEVVLCKKTCAVETINLVFGPIIVNCQFVKSSVDVISWICLYMYVHIYVCIINKDCVPLFGWEVNSWQRGNQEIHTTWAPMNCNYSTVFCLFVLLL